MKVFGRELTAEQLIGMIRANADPDGDLVHTAALELAEAAEDALRYEANSKSSLRKAQGAEATEKTTVETIIEYENTVLSFSESPNEKRIALAVIRELEELQRIKRTLEPRCSIHCLWFGARHQKCNCCNRNRRNLKDNYTPKAEEAGGENDG